MRYSFGSCNLMALGLQSPRSHEKTAKQVGLECSQVTPSTGGESRVSGSMGSIFMAPIATSSTRNR